MKKEIRDLIMLLVGLGGTLFGLIIFTKGFFGWNYFEMVTGLLAMILGELVDFQVRLIKKLNK